MIPASFAQWHTPTVMRQHAEELLKQVGVPTDRKSTSDLSRGEQQRVAIARALLFDLPIILADEPTASLDEKAAQIASNNLLSLAGHGRTILIVSHDKEIIERCDQVIEFEKGHLVGMRISPSLDGQNPTSGTDRS